MAYSLCVMADFQNGLISGIFGLLLRVSLRRTTVNDL